MTLWTVACRLLCPWDSPGKNTRVDCHLLRGEQKEKQELGDCCGGGAVSEGMRDMNSDWICFRSRLIGLADGLHMRHKGERIKNVFKVWSNLKQSNLVTHDVIYRKGVGWLRN